MTTVASSRSVFADVTASEATLRRFLHGLPGVDQVGAEARAATLVTRSIKTTAKQFALEVAIRMVDLTTLGGADTPGKVRALCNKAMRPDPSDPSCPAVAAVCVYGDLVPIARKALSGSDVHIAAVATAFPGACANGSEARRYAWRCGGRGRRDRHGHRPGSVPLRPLPRGVR